MHLEFLSKTYPTNKNLFLVPKFALRTIGFFPEPNKTIRAHILAVMSFFGLAYCFYAELLYGLWNLVTDPIEAMDALCPMTTCVTTIFKLFFLWFHREEFRKLIERIRALTEERWNDSVQKREIKLNYFSMVTRMNALVFFFSVSTTTSFLIRPIAINLVNYYNGESFSYITAFKMRFPDFMYAIQYYPITYVYSIWCGHATSAGFCGVDGLFFGCCLYFTCLLKMLQLDAIEALDIGTDANDAENRICLQKMRNIIQRHSDIAEMIRRFSRIVAAFTLLHFISASVVIAAGIINLIFISNSGGFVYIFYICAVTSESFLYCFGGNLIVESSQELGVVAYSTRWTSFSVKVQKMLLLLILRSQKAFEIRIPFVRPSLALFASILRFTGSIITLAKSIL